ncbi:MAG: hydantoinase/oxoprolinase family protein [Rhodobacteraceae bacterium]|nr:hydantoinase/oxoprolinase family protein [Paracoccaceae bacterium]MBT6271660.1 hydantoinase/oxoprolinase family protein [Paracoccaceae bacterium]MBT6437075.1 hydantoinase/oxoprolinase family protein [Paracoccaceae bacterium]
MGGKDFSIAIDIGGTFTDSVIANKKGKVFKVAKTASTPSNPSQGFIKSVTKVLKLADVDPSSVEVVLHGSTVVTNAILENKGAKTALITTKGFRHVLEIGRAEIPRESNLYGWIKPNRPIKPRDIFEVSERIRYDGTIFLPLDINDLNAIVKVLKEENYDAVAISLIHSYANPTHEKQLGRELSKLLPNIEISLSFEVLPIFREYERAMATVINASVQPIVSSYMKELTSELACLKINAPLFIMKSNGGIFTPKEAAKYGVHMALSGPAAGMSGAAYTGSIAGYKNLITIDMGGTSADVALVKGGMLQTSTGARINHQPLALPIIDIHTIGAGGGSIASVAKNGAILVGPESAGATPGPAAYNLGGTRPTVTDANLILGRIPPHLLGGTVLLDKNAAYKAIDEFVAKPLGTNVIEASLGIIKIVNETMHGALKLMSVERGLDPADFILTAFGGAGPVHGGDLMRLLSASGLLIPRYPGILCANGLLTTDLKYDFALTKLQRANKYDYNAMNLVFEDLEKSAQLRLSEDRVSLDRRVINRAVDLRYAGQGTELTVSFPQGLVTKETTQVAVKKFHDLHKQLYTFSDDNSPVEIINLRVQALGKSDHIGPPLIMKSESIEPKTKSVRRVVIDQTGYEDVSVFDRESLLNGHEILGPAIIDQLDSTTLILRDQKLKVDKFGNLLIRECANE